jgi:hypothetical protein
MSMYSRTTLPLLVILAVSSGWTACGSPPPSISDAGCPNEMACSPIDGRLLGEWVVEVEVTESKEGPVHHTGRMVLTGTDTGMVAMPICMDGTGEMVLTGSGLEADWSGTLACPSPTASCPRRSIGYTRGFFGVINGDQLRGQFGGVVLGCGDERSFTATFSGRR